MGFGNSVHKRLPGGAEARAIWLRGLDPNNRPGHRERERERMAAAALVRCGLSNQRAASLIALLEGHEPRALVWLADAEQAYDHARRTALAQEAAQNSAMDAVACVTSAALGNDDDGAVEYDPSVWPQDSNQVGVL